MSTSRHGLTLFEWLVLIICTLIILGLLIPAVETRSPPRRTGCAVNLKNLALAAIQYDNAHGQFPGFVMDFGTWTAGPVPMDPNDPDADTSTLVSHRKIGSWAVALTPWLEGQVVYEHWTYDRYPIAFGGSKKHPLSTGLGGIGFNAFAAPNLSIMRCPADPMDDGPHGANSYICNAGMYHRGTAGEESWTISRGENGETTIDFARSMSLANGVFNNKFAGLGRDGKPVAVGPAIMHEDCKDGKSNTVLFSESLQAMPWHRAGLIDARDLVLSGDGEIPFVQSSRYTQGMVWHYEDAKRIDGAAAVKAVHRINGVPEGEDLFDLTMNATNAADLARPSSAHVDGVNAAMADGSTRFITDSIDYRVYQAMLTPQGWQSDVPFQEFVLTDELEK